MFFKCISQIHAFLVLGHMKKSKENLFSLQILRFFLELFLTFLQFYILFCELPAFVIKNKAFWWVAQEYILSIITKCPFLKKS